jgi:hypothetical protein
MASAKGTAPGVFRRDHASVANTAAITVPNVSVMT